MKRFTLITQLELFVHFILVLQVKDQKHTPTRHARMTDWDEEKRQRQREA